MFKVKIEKNGQEPLEVSYYGRHDAFTAAIGFYQTENDKWGEGYLHACRRYVSIGNIAAMPFSFRGNGMRITITDARAGE